MIRSNQTALINGEREPANVTGPSDSSQELDAFLSSLRQQWQQREPSKRGGCHVPTRSYLTQVDPTMGCWPLVLQWLMADPLLIGQQAMQRLEQEQPGLYGGSLRTLPRRMAEWRVRPCRTGGGPADGGNLGPGEQPAQQ